MSPRSTAFSLVAIASFLTSSIALPFAVPQLPPRFSVVNVDGSSSPTTPSASPAVTQTIVNTVTAPGTTSIVTVNVDSGIETVFVTVAPTPVVATSAAPTPAAPTPTPSAPLPPTIPSGSDSPPLNTNSTSSSLPSNSLKADKLPSIATTSTPCEPTPEVLGDGAPLRQGYDTTPTGTYPIAPATSGYDASATARPSGMTAPLPVLPPTTPYFLNITESPKVRRRVVVS